MLSMSDDPHQLSGSCHVAVVLLTQFHDHRQFLPESLIPQASYPTDVATVGDIFRGIKRNFWCLETMGLPAGAVVGKRKNLGVFFWSPQSEISRLYRSHNILDSVSGALNATNGLISQSGVASRGFNTTNDVPDEVSTGNAATS